MEFGILGLELGGKTTLFSLLTGHLVGPAHGKAATHVGIAQVPDARLDSLSALFKPKKHTPATVRFVDVPGITKGGAQGLNVPELRSMDGLAVVVRGFGSDAVPHPEGSVDPARDLADQHRVGRRAGTRRRPVEAQPLLRPPGRLVRGPGRGPEPVPRSGCRV